MFYSFPNMVSEPNTRLFVKIPAHDLMISIGSFWRQICNLEILSCLIILGHGLNPLDIEFMQQLHDKVNIIPVIAKGKQNQFKTRNFIVSAVTV